MKTRALLLLTAPFLALTTFGAQTKPIEKALELTAEVVSQNYCAVNKDFSTLDLKLKLRFRNIGSQKLILYRGHDFFYQTKIRTAPGNASDPYEVWVVNSRYFDEGVEGIDQGNTRQGLC